MGIMLLVARLTLAGVFLVAGIGKLSDRAGSRRAMEGFGVPVRLAGVAGIAIPILEIILAFALIPNATAWWAAVGALGLLLVFLAVLGYNIARGRAPDCHCFGQIHSEPAGARTLVRNGILASIAFAIVTLGYGDPGTSVSRWMGDLTGVERTGVVIAVASLVVVSGLAWGLIQFMRQNGRLLIQLEAMEESLDAGRQIPHGSGSVIQPGAPAPDFILQALDGEDVSLESLRDRGAPVLLIFSDADCPACTGLLPTLATWQADNRLTVAIIGRGDPDANRAKAAKYGLSTFLLQQNREVALAYGADVTPSGLVVDPSGIVTSPLVRGSEAIRALVARVLPPPVAERPEALPVRSLAPSLALTDLEGNVVFLDQYLGTDTIVLFWNPACGYCQRLLPEVRAWEFNPPMDSPNLVVVSQGSVEANRALGFRAPVLLADAVAGAPFGIAGTPGAIEIDANGAIASSVRMGAQSVMGLLNLVAAPQSGSR